MPSPLHIESPQNEWVKEHRPEKRRALGLVFAEGAAVVEEALAGQWDILAGVVRLDQVGARPWMKMLSGHRDRIARFVTLSETAYARLSDCETPPGIGVLARPGEILPVPPDKDHGRRPLLILDGVTDPGNLGTLLRSAAAFGFRVQLTRGCASPVSDKVARASAGAIFRQPWHGPTGRREVREYLERNGAWRRILLDAGGKSVLEPKLSAEPREQVAIVLGSESHGARAEDWPEFETTRIPMLREAESLNAAVAASIAMHAFATEVWMGRD